MVLSGQELEKALKQFGEVTEGVLGSSIIYSKDALVVAEDVPRSSTEFRREVLQAMSERLLQMTHKVLESLLDHYSLQKVLIEEENHFIFLRPINDEYFLVVITGKDDAQGIIEHNLKKLIATLQANLVE